ncbi:hypothetical protein NQZ68_025593 [Dissostichus eleginoides]|nr:hypothetical protein NQZ68_025593 [Dissostichus eleginoides]
MALVSSGNRLASRLEEGVTGLINLQLCSGCVGLVIYIKMRGSQTCDRLSPSSTRGAHSPPGSSHRLEETVRYNEL